MAGVCGGVWVAGMEAAISAAGGLSALAVVLAGGFSFWAVARQHRLDTTQARINALEKELRDGIVLEYAAVAILSERDGCTGNASQNTIRKRAVEKRAVEMGGNRPSRTPSEFGLSISLGDLQVCCAHAQCLPPPLRARLVGVRFGPHVAAMCFGQERGDGATTRV